MHPAFPRCRRHSSSGMEWVRLCNRVFLACLMGAGNHVRRSLGSRHTRVALEGRRRWPRSKLHACMGWFLSPQTLRPKRRHEGEEAFLVRFPKHEWRTRRTPGPEQQATFHPDAIQDSLDCTGCTFSTRHRNDTYGGWLQLPRSPLVLSKSESKCAVRHQGAALRRSH